MVGVALEVAEREFRLEAVREGCLVLLDDSHEFAQGEFLVDKRGFCWLLSVGEPPAHEAVMIVMFVEVDAVEPAVLDEAGEYDLLLKAGERAAWTFEPKECFGAIAAVVDFRADLEVLDATLAHDAREVVDCRTGSDGELAFDRRCDGRFGVFLHGVSLPLEIPVRIRVKRVRGAQT